jgi:hypothetical protein
VGDNQNRGGLVTVEKVQYWQLCGAIGGFWVVILITGVVGFFAGRSTVQLRVDVAPSHVTVAPANVTVGAAKPASVEVTVPVPVVNVANTIPHGPAPVVNIDNKVPPSVVNVLVDGKTAKVERVEERKPIAAPVVPERDPDGKTLPPPRS